MLTLFDANGHKNVCFHDLTSGHMVQANQHVVVHANEALVLDPGGHKVHTKLFAEISAVVSMSQVKHLFFSHQDPDIIAAANAWLMMTDAKGYLSSLWMRFITHFGIDELVVSRLVAIPDEGGTITVGGQPLELIPAHFLHSPGNFHVYDPVSKILYTGDLGASLGQDTIQVTDFDAHIPHMEGFHRRYMAGNRALRAWAERARKLDIETIAPQHGAMMAGKPLVERFISWAENLSCGTDILFPPGVPS
ncbi:MAG: FprA family A-type flavoprotein [Thermoanaerobaculia bacterium]|nr:FprA family A-type flavoprotein [Thermoanaerobaculia bacterium]